MQSRFVVLTCPLTEATRGLLDARRLGLMRRDALLGLPNVLLTPHAAGLTEESMAAMSDGAAEEVVRVLRGEGWGMG